MKDTRKAELAAYVAIAVSCCASLANAAFGLGLPTVPLMGAAFVVAGFAIGYCARDEKEGRDE